jgi:hypothetical protein
MQRDRGVNKSARTLGTFLSRAHRNAGLDGNAAEDGSSTFQNEPEERDAPTTPVAPFYI